MSTATATPEVAPETNFYQEKETICIGFDIELAKQTDAEGKVTLVPVMKDGQKKRSFAAYGYNNEKQVNAVKA